MHSIVLILPYFGEFSASNAFWLKSAEKNPEVDFLLLTDQHVDVLSPNVRVIGISFKKCVEGFQRMLDCDISSLHPYKLCDFKPAYGYLFQEYIRGYDFWGHCDNDIILGNIRHFITEEVLEGNDRILTRGHFTLYRNTAEVNETFKKASPSYKTVFPSELVFHFDEHPGTGRYWFDHRADRLYDEIVFDDLDWHDWQFKDVHKHDTIDKGRRHFIYQFENGNLYRCFWEDGHVGREEIMYAHFQKRDMKTETPVADCFTIVPNKFVEYEPHLTHAYLKKNTLPRPLYAPLHFVRVKWNSLKRKVWLWKRRRQRKTGESHTGCR